MSKKVLIPTGLGAGVVLIFALLLVFVAPFREGVIHTIKGTSQNTVDLVISTNKEPVLSPTDEEGLGDRSEQPIEPKEEFGKDTGSSKGVEEPKDTQKAFREDDKLRVYILDTKGNSIIFQNGKDIMLVDGGYSTDVPTIKAKLKELGATRIKYMVVSNYHLATLQGVPQILDNYPADYIILSGNVMTQENGKVVTSYLTRKGLIWTIPSNTGSMSLGTSSVKFLSSNKGGSLLTFVNHNRTNITVSGTTQYFEEVIFKYLPSNIDLHIATHGMQGYTVPEELIDKLNPKTIILNNDKGISDNKTVKVLSRPSADLYRLSDTGNIAVGSNGEDLNIIFNTK